jgi:hypothetical protein
MFITKILSLNVLLSVFGQLFCKPIFITETRNNSLNTKQKKRPVRECVLTLEN